MPLTTNLNIKIDQSDCELGERQNLGLRLSYTLEDPENFEQKQASMSLGISVPATPVNDRIFNSYHNSKILDMSGDGSYTNFRRCNIIVNGVELLTGFALLKSASYTRIPGSYNFDAYGQNGDWVIDMQDLTLWDCLNTTPHTFDVATVEASWGVAFDSDEFHDYTYAPVRYRQPFGNNDDTVNIYHLRPSLSIYWILFRAFRQFGYRIDSKFINTANYFRRFVLPWVWGDFYDINSQLTDGMSFKAAGILPNTAPAGFGPPAGFTDWIFFSGVAASGTPPLDADNTGWVPWNYGAIGTPGAIGYVKTLTETQSGTGSTLYQNFRLNNTAAPNGYDNFGLYSFDDATGTMQYTFAPPASLAPFIGANVTLNFVLDLIARIENGTGGGSISANLFIEIQVNSGPLVLEPFNELSTSTHGAILGSLLYPTVHNFSVPNINPGDVIKFRLKYELTNTFIDCLDILSSGWVNVNPSATGSNPWQYNPVTQKWANLTYAASTTQWQQMFSTLQMSGLQIAVGNDVHFQWYDKFRSYRFLDLFRGLIDLFNWSVQTNPITRVVTIEPTHDYTLPDGTRKPGYFVPQRLDWTDKQDVSKENVNTLFSSIEREFNFQFKQDGSDGGQNIYAARYKGIYLNNRVSNSFNGLNNTNNENSISAAIPGSSRYMLPSRFSKGARQQVNRFFSATMHYNHAAFANITTILSGGSAPPISPQLICIIPENINDTSASAVTQTFEPKIAFYAGPQAIFSVGGWRWIGDPNAGGTGIATYHDGGTPNAIGFALPYMFAVDYSGRAPAPGEMIPVLSYCDQNIGGVVKAGLMKTYFLKRMATMRHGKQDKLWIRLNLGDITDWEHRNSIIINGALYYLIGIDNYDPLSDDSAQCLFWKAENPDQEDLDNCFPSSSNILTSPTILAQFDIKYAKLLLFQSDLPQVG